MRNLRLLVLLAPALFLPLGCEDSSSSSGGMFAFEAGGGFDSSTPDAGPPPDAGTDSSVIPPAPKGVSVTVTLGATPQANIRVLAHDGAGAVIGDVKTGATGRATFATAPSMVTVLTASGTGGGSSVSPITYAGVADGDNLVVTIPTPSINSQVPFARYSVSFAASAQTVNATSFSVYASGTPEASCNGSSSAQATPASVDLYPGCLGAKNGILASASNNTGAVVGMGFLKNVAKPAMGATDPAGPITFAAPGKTTVKASNLPTSGVNPIHFGRLISIANGAAFDIGLSTGSLDTGDLSFSTATGFADAYQSLVVSETHGLGAISEKAFVRREATTALAVANLATFDFVNALPFITDVALASPTPARPDISFVSDAALTGSDAGLVAIQWSVLTAETSGTWLFVLPPSSTGFKVPALPADAAAYVPAANVAVSAAIFFDATQLMGFKDVKALPISTKNAVDFIDFNRPLPSAGTVRLTSYRNGQRL